MIKQLYVLLPALIIPLFFCVMNTPWLAPAPSAEVPVEVGDVFPKVLMGILSSAFIMLIPFFLYMLCYRPLPEWLKWRSWPLKEFYRDYFFIVLFAVFFMVLLAPQERQSNLQFLVLFEGFTAFQKAFIVFSISIGVPLCEELLFRGVLLHILQPRVGIFLSAIFFGLAHGLSIYTFPLILTGWCFALVTYRTGSIFPAAIMHILFNSMNLVLI